MTFLKVVGFSLVVLFAYTLFANILPQVQSNPPAEEETVAEGVLDLAGMVAWGEKLFAGKGSCTLCHNDLGRAPDLLALDLRATFAERLADPGYAGAAKGQTGAQAIETYLRESFIDPSAYVVAGFGKKGTEDRESPMPAADKPPIQLSEPQIDAVIAFLQDRAGFEVTVSLPTAEAVPAEAEEEDADAEGPAKTAEAAIEKYTCNACHDLLQSGGEAGPALAGIGARLGRAGIREAILNPNAIIAEGFEADIMPSDYGEQMWVNELELIVDYLMKLEAQG